MIRPVGRPPVDNPKCVKLTVRINRETDAILTAYSHSMGLSRMDAVRHAIELLKKAQQ